MTENSQDGNARTRSSAGTGCRHWLTEKRQALQQEHDLYLRHETRWSWARLGVFAVGLLVVILLRHELLWASVAAVAFLLVFFGAVLRHLDWQDKRQCAAHHLTVVDESIYDPGEQGKPVRAWTRPANATHEAAALPGILASGPCRPITDQERDDLDLFSPPVGIFGLLNRCSTDLGSRRLRDFLDGPLLLPDPIRQRQQAVTWLSSSHEQRIHIMASVLPLRKHTEDLDQLVQLLQQTEPNARTLASKCIRLGSCFTGILGAYMLVQFLQFNLSLIGPFILLVCFNSAIAWLFGSMLGQVKDSMSPYIPLTFSLRCLLEHAERANQTLPQETQLSVLKGCFAKLVQQGRIPSLCQYLEFASLGGVARGLLNTLMFYDLHIGEAVLSRVVAQRDTLLQGLSALAELEALNSLACFSAEQTLACFPELDTDTGLSIQNGQHPLVPDQENVPNSIQLTANTRTWVVTGPNAAGKSTFLRMVGVNCLLAQIGAAVTTQAMHFSPVRLMTDVRVRDDLAKHESYFLSEVRRLRRIIRDAQVSPPILGFIDEPFRGTNSQERTAAGVALLEHLLASGHLVLVATHEERLAQCAARHSDAENYHFQEQLIDAGIKFDYCLRPGPAHTKTAIRILEQEGYPGSFLERARALMEAEESG